MAGPAREEIKRIKLPTPPLEARLSPTTKPLIQAQEPKRGIFPRFRSLIGFADRLNGEESVKKPGEAESNQPSDDDYAKIARSLGHDDLPFEPGDEDANDHPSSGSMKP
jgi:hypothetical protein